MSVLALQGPDSLLLRAADRLTRHIPKTLMYHKFASLSGTVEQSVALFEQQLQYIDRHLRHRLVKSPALRGEGLCLTVDDGYLDFYTLAYPLLKKYEIPATFFVTTGFINGELWLWYDKVEYLFKQSEKAEYSMQWHDQRFCGDLTQDRAGLLYRTTQYLKQWNLQTIDVFIQALASALEVELPVLPPEPYRPCSWEQLKEMDGPLITIGAHSHTHPILSRVEPALLAGELDDSKVMLEQQLGHKVSAFCYPNGQNGDYTAEIAAHLQQLGFAYAVTAYSDGHHVRDPFQLRRFGGVHSMTQFKKHVHGVEFLSKRWQGIKQGRLTALKPS